MKKRITFALALSAMAAFAQNLLVNPSFEELTADGLPQGWNILRNNAADAALVSEKETAFDGKLAVRIENKGENADKSQLIWIQSGFEDKMKQLATGTTMEVSVMAYAVDKPAMGRIYMESIKAHRCYIIEKTIAPGKWQKLSQRFAIEDVDYANPYVCIQLLGNGNIIFDGAYLGPVGENPWTLVKPDNGNFVLNGSAEEPIEGGFWNIINRTANGAAASIDGQKASHGSHSFRLSSPLKPDGMISWLYNIPIEILKTIEPGTELAIMYDANVGSNPDTKFQCYAEFTQNGKYIGTFMSDEKTVYAGWETQIFKFQMPQEKPTNGYIVVQLLTAGYFNFDNVKLIPASSLPPSEAVISANDYCRFLNQPRNSNFIAPQVPSKLTLECFLPDPRLHVELAVIDGDIVKSWDIGDLPVRKTATVEIDLPTLAPEAYELKYTSGNLTDYDWFRVSEKDSLRVKFDDNDILLVDGAHFFPIGICTPLRNPDAMRIYSLSGINAISAGLAELDADVNEYYTLALAKFGLRSFEWNDWGYRNEPVDEIRKRYMRKSEILKGKKGFICFLSDEAMWGNVSIDSMRKYYRLMFKYAPDYPAWVNHAPRLSGSPDLPRQSFDNGRRFSRAGNMTGADIYPIPEGHGHNDLENRTMSCVGDYTDICRRLTWDTKPVWMVLQAFGWSEEGGKLNAENPRPTEKELRFMVWNAITHGARGIVWYGAGCFDVYSEWWAMFAKINLELKAVTDLMPLSPIEEVKNLPKGVRGIRGKGYAVYVNENKTEAVVEGQPLGERCVRLLVDGKPLAIAAPQRFRPEKQSLGKELAYEVGDIDVAGDWVAHPEFSSTPNATVFSMQKFNLETLPKKAVLYASADDFSRISLNGKDLGHRFNGNSTITIMDVTSFLHTGENTMAVTLTNSSGPMGVRYEIRMDGKSVSSGNDTLFSKDGKADWVKPHNYGKVHTSFWYRQIDIRRIK